MRVTISKSCYFVLAVLFVQMLFLPKLYMWIKAICILIAIIFCIYMCKDHVRITNGRVLMLIYLALNVISTVIGIGKGYHTNAIRSATINIIWPVCFFIMMDIYLGEKQLVWLYKAIIRSTFALCIWDIAFMFFRSKWIADITLYLNRNAPRFQVFSGWYLRVDHLYFYAFLIPFMMGVVLNSDTEFLKKNNISKSFINITFFLSVLMAAVSGMGGVWLACVIGIIICFFEFHLLLKRRRVLVLIVALAAFMLGFSIVSYSGEGIVYQIAQEISSKLDYNALISGKGGSVRINQAKGMLEAWMEAPILGQGVGCPVSYYRSGEYVTQTDNELQYLIMLYQRGILGVVSFFLIVAYAVHVLKARKDIDWLSGPFMIGMVSFLTVNAFNPYLANLSTMWILFFPLLLENRNKCFVV